MTLLWFQFMGDLLPQVYEALMWGAVTGRSAAITGATPGASAKKDVQTVRFARANPFVHLGEAGETYGTYGFFLDRSEW